MIRIAGIYDLARSRGSLGTLLILLAELEIQCRIHSAGKADVIFVSDARQLITGAAPQSAGGSGTNITALTAVARAMSGIADCHEFYGPTAIADAMSLAGSGCMLWPDPDNIVRGAHNYDSTAAIQAFFARTGSIPRLSVTDELLSWAESYLREKSGGRLPVAVHLKNNPNVSGQSNANLKSWRSLFGSEDGRNAHFFLVGDEVTNTVFSSLPNVTVAQRDGICLPGYLALIQAAKLFMGMMSGPANMALFGMNPYVIFKNPDHHSREMALELGNADRYSFALSNQRVLRIWDTPENLIGAFEYATQELAASQ